VLLQNARSATGNWNQAFDLSVYLDKKAATERACEALAKQLRSAATSPRCASSRPTQALAEFREYSGFGKALDALDDNPLPDTLVVTPTLPRAPRGHESRSNGIAAMPDVQAVQLDTEWVKRLHAMLDILRRVVLAHRRTARAWRRAHRRQHHPLDILNRRAEIEVMKLVGATDGFARRPFLYSGVWYGLGGGLALIAGRDRGRGARRPVGQLAALYGSQFRLEGLRFGITARVLGCSRAWAGWAPGLLRRGISAASTHLSRRMFLNAYKTQHELGTPGVSTLNLECYYSP
jgi:cell division transport system permease protein